MGIQTGQEEFFKMDKNEMADSSKNKIEKMVQKKYGKKRTNEAFVYAKRIKSILEKMVVEGIGDASIKASILKIIDKRPEILMVQFGNQRCNLGMIAADLKAEWFVLKALLKWLVLSPPWPQSCQGSFLARFVER